VANKDPEELLDEPGFDPGAAGKPPLHKWPQRKYEATLRKSAAGHVLTFDLRVFRLICMNVTVALPRPGSTRSPVYVRFWIDPSQQDFPARSTFTE
jgi:hypothetical protein